MEYLDGCLKIIQSLFFIVAGTVAVLTYRAARYGVLNTINTEYHKRIIDKLYALNEDISKAFALKKTTHWTVADEREEFYKRLTERFKENKYSIITDRPTEAAEFGLPLVEVQIYLFEASRKYQNEPFLPEEIRNMVLGLVKDRLDGLLEAFEDASNRLVVRLHDPKEWANIDRYEPSFSNHVNEELYKRNVGISQIQDRIKLIQKAIDDYFLGFNALPNTEVGMKFLIRSWIKWLGPSRPPA